MSRLVVNPGTPHAWEIHLKPGANLLGRGAASDFKIEDPSVSGSHCQIISNNGQTTIKDLGSTNGTYVNRSRVSEMSLESGYRIQLGAVELLYESSPLVPAPVVPSAVPLSTPPIPPPLNAGNRMPALNGGSTITPTVITPRAITPTPEPEPAHAASAPPDAGAPPQIPVTVGAVYCKFHPKSFARYRCNKCNRTFCELCITARTTAGVTKKTCRSCGVDVIPLQVRIEHVEPPSFFSTLPGAFLYPFRGTGILVIIVGTFLMAALDIMGRGGLNILMTIVALGYLFSYMQGIIHSTASEDKEMPELPGFDGVFSGFLCLAGTVLISFGIPLGLIIAVFCKIDVPGAAIMAFTIFGCLYFPMAFLAVAIKDTALAGNPLIVLPSIMKVPVEYLVTVVVMVSIYGVQKLGDLIASMANVTFTTRSMSVLLIAFGLRACWSFISVYLMTVNMRILGMLYLSKRDDLGW